MAKQSSSRNHRGKKLRPKHILQVFLLVAVIVWLMYQLPHSYSKRRAVALAITDNNGVDGELVRQRRLGRKDLVDDFAGRTSGDDAPGISGGEIIVGSDGNLEQESMPDWLSTGGTGEGGDTEEEDEEPDEDDDGLRAADDEDDKDFHTEDGDGEDGLKTMHRKNDRLQDGPLVNAQMVSTWLQSSTAL